MSGRSKGFDPLSNLFTDTPAAASTGAEASVPDPAVEPSAVTDPAFDPAAAPAVPTQVAGEPDPVDRVALAKRLAAEAQARADEAVAADKVALAKKLAAEAQARAASKAEDDKTQSDKAALAKALAKAAIAKSAGSSSPAPKPKKSLADRAPRSLSERAGAGRRMSALEAARAAAAAEAARKEASAESAKASSVPASMESAGGLLAGALGPDVTEEAPRLAQQRDLLTALWKAHTQRHIQDRRWNVAGACAAVVDALDRVGPGQLVAVSAKAEADELLVWFDVGRRSIVAVIPDGRAYLAGL